MSSKWLFTWPKRIARLAKSWIEYLFNASSANLKPSKSDSNLKLSDHFILKLILFFKKKIEEQIDGQYRLIQKKIKELEPNKLRAYNDLLAKQREMQDRIAQSESRVNEINSRIRQYESDEKSNSLRKEYLNLEKSYQTLRRDADSLHEELEIANLVCPFFSFINLH